MRLYLTTNLIFPYAFISVALFFGSGFAAVDEASQKVPRFKSDIRPIFEANCLVCHGDNLQKNGLDLRTRESVLKGVEPARVVKEILA